VTACVRQGQRTAVSATSKSLLLRKTSGSLVADIVTAGFRVGPLATNRLVASGAAGLGSRGREGFIGLLLGSVGQECAVHAPCPVVIVKDTRETGTSQH
jgi:hypothetical protein